ncbi:MAG TPA: 50S ribosomal protein L24 [Candidatus Saccharimonadales bacterium]|nr:50S ribosomal protein L24 [Candidatus Saccharimonadales bacterium]
MSSMQPRIQRFRRFNAPMHVRQKFAHAHISKELKAKLGIKRRAVQVRKGDTVKVMSGKNLGKAGKVNRVDLKDSTVLIDGIVRKTAKGKELQVPIRISKVYITDLDLSDSRRKAKLGVS